MKASNPYLKLELNIFNKLHIMNLIEDLGYEGFGTFIAVKILMAENEHFPVDYVKLVAKNLDIDSEYLQKLMNRKDLFYIKDGEYINDEVLDNLATVAIKSENGEKAARIRWEKEKAKKEAAAKAAKQNTDGETPINEIELQPDNVIIDKIIDYYKEVFDKNDFSAGEETREKIADICNKNNKNVFKNKFFEHWQTIFDNAKKGWKFKDGKKKPSFKTILKEWDAFLSGDYYLDETYLSPAEEEIAHQLQSGQKISNSDIDEYLSEYDEYTNAPDDIKLEAQKIYQESCKKDISKKGAIQATKAAIFYCREQVQNA